MKKLAMLFMAFVGLLLGLFTQSYAAIDVTAVTTGITDAQTALTTIIDALMALSVAIFGIVMVYRFVHRKSGA